MWLENSVSCARAVAAAAASKRNRRMGVLEAGRRDETVVLKDTARPRWSQ